MEETIKSNIMKAQLSGIIKILAYSLSLIVLITVFIFIMSTIISPDMLIESLSLVGVSFPSFSTLFMYSLVIFFLVLIGNAIFILINLDKKEVKFYDDKLSYYDKIWLDLPFKNVVSINFSKNFFSGDKITLTLTGTSKEKIEIPYIDNAEETCKKLNSFVKKI